MFIIALVCFLIAIVTAIMIYFMAFTEKTSDSEGLSLTIKKPVVAIVTLMKAPSDLDLWLHYHLNILKVAHIYITVDDSPEVIPILRPFQDRITVTHIRTPTNQRFNTYITNMDRQREMVKTAIVEARKAGFRFLLHIDCDELFMVSSNYTDVNDFFSRYAIDPSCADIHFENIEATFSGQHKHNFDATHFIECRRGQCSCYANGKSACQLNDPTVAFNGPHSFSGSRQSVKIQDAVVLHFDGWSYDAWKTKFKRLAYTNAAETAKIPFAYYRQSIQYLRKGASEDACQALWRSWKLRSADLEYVKPLSDFINPICLVHTLPALFHGVRSTSSSTSTSGT